MFQEHLPWADLSTDLHAACTITEFFPHTGKTECNESRPSA